MPSRLRMLIIGAAVLISPARAQSSDNSSTTYYANSTTLSTLVQPVLNPNATGSIDTLYPGTNLSARITDIFSSALNGTASPGGAILINTPNNGTYFQSFGSSQYDGDEPFRLDSHIRIASNTKTFTGSAVLKLASEGKLSLNDTWDKYYNGSLGTFPYAQNITVANLLSMTSGVYDYVVSSNYSNGPNLDPTQAFTYDQAISIIIANTPYFAPGDTQSFNYSNSNYLMLGHVVEVASGVPDRQYILENFVEPLNLTGTSWPTTFALPEPYAQGYSYYPPNDTVGIRDATLYNTENAGAAGAMVSTLREMQTWVEAMFRGYGLSDELAARRRNDDMLPLQGLPAGVNLTYGLALLGLNGFYGHDGGIKGFSTLMMTNPLNNITVCWVGTQGADNGPGGVSLPTALEIFSLLKHDE